MITWYNNKAVGRENTPEDKRLSILKIEQCTINTLEDSLRFILMNYLRSQAEDKIKSAAKYSEESTGKIIDRKVIIELL